MTDSEIAELERFKEDLILKLSKMRNKLREQEKLPRRGKKYETSTALEDLLPKNFDDPHNVKQKQGVESLQKMMPKLCKASQSILGVQFKNVRRNWVHDNVYRYDTVVFTKAIEFALELTVNIPSKEKFQIEDINCHFLKLDKCYIEEIAPWALRFTHEKNLSCLISAISEYSEVSIVRAKILRTVESKGYASMEKFNDKDGGILVYVFPPWAQDQFLFKFHWFTKFVNRTEHVEHIFSIEPIQAGDKFMEEHKDVLQGFCESGLGKTDLEKLWSDLCKAINTLNESDEDT